MAEHRNVKDFQLCGVVPLVRLNHAGLKSSVGDITGEGLPHLENHGASFKVPEYNIT